MRMPMQPAWLATTALFATGAAAAAYVGTRAIFAIICLTAGHNIMEEIYATTGVAFLTLVSGAVGVLVSSVEH